MPLTPTHKLILHSLGQFYRSLNQPLSEKPVRVRTSKIAFIELLLQSSLISKQERAVYKNLELLEKKKLIGYENRMITFTEKGLKQLGKVQQELAKVEQELQQRLQPYKDIDNYFQGDFQKGERRHRQLQTVMCQK